jgi:hypothetical protein
LAQILVVIALLGVRTAAALDPERQLSEIAHGLFIALWLLALAAGAFLIRLYIALRRGSRAHAGLEAE